MKEKPGSKASQLRKAERTLRALLKTPKTRAGLIAAVGLKGSLSRDYVLGWLSARRHDGTVTMLMVGKTQMYQITQAVVEVPAESPFPSWMDPRFIPPTATRQVFVDGLKVNADYQQKQ